MKINKLVTLGLAATLVLSGAYADDFDLGSDDFSFDSGDFSFGDSGDSSSPVEISGDVSSDARLYLPEEDEDELEDSEIDGGVAADLDVKYSGAKADAEIKLNLNSDTLKLHPEEIIDEAFITAYLGNFKLEAGKMKNVWGKGDKLHVIDNFNADDYSDFIIPDYLDRRIATPMVKGSYAFDYSGNVLSNMKIEGIYTPFMPVDRFADSGRWTPSQVSSLTDTVTAKTTAYLAGTIENLENARLMASEAQTLKDLYAQGDLTAYQTLSSKISDAYSAGLITADTAKIQALMMAGKTQAEATQLVLAQAYAEYVEANLTAANTAYTYALNNASALSSDTGILYPEINSLKYGQAGARFTASLGPVDLGMSYYYGHYKQPSVNASKVDSYIAKYLGNETVTDDDKFLAYDQKQTFGIEAATILWHFNLRGEACYNLTEDVDGTDPWVHNNSVQWLGGFDIDLPFWNMNVNVQETGTYILNNDEITGSPYETLDVDYNKNGYSNNKVVANITTSFQNDKIQPEVTVMYGIENSDLVVLPKLSVKPTSELSLTASGMYVWCKDENSEFSGWDKNNFVQLGATLSF